MDQVRQLQSSLRQLRQNFDNMTNQISQQLMHTEQVAQDISSQQTFFQQGTTHTTQYQTPQYGRGSQYQYSPHQTGYTQQNSASSQYSDNYINPISDLNESKPTMRQQNEVNQYGTDKTEGYNDKSNQ